MQEVYVGQAMGVQDVGLERNGVRGLDGVSQQ